MSLGYGRPNDLSITLSTIMQDIIDDKSVNFSKNNVHHNKGVDLLPYNIELSGLEVRLIKDISRKRVLKTCINEVKKIMMWFFWIVCRTWGKSRAKANLSRIREIPISKIDKKK